MMKALQMTRVVTKKMIMEITMMKKMIGLMKLRQMLANQIMTVHLLQSARLRILNLLTLTILILMMNRILTFKNFFHFNNAWMLQIVFLRK